MQKIATAAVNKESWSSPGGRFHQLSQPISVALGRDEKSADPAKRHPFDLELCSVLPKSSACPYHAHSAQWEMYVFLSGDGIVRARDGRHAVVPGDVVVFPPGEAHEIINESDAPLSFYIIADNPVGESCYYPDSDKWLVRNGSARHVFTGTEVDYLFGEDPRRS